MQIACLAGAVAAGYGFQPFGLAGYLGRSSRAAVVALPPTDSARIDVLYFLDFRTGWFSSPGKAA